MGRIDNYTGGEDTLAWALEKSGIYSVKSAYRSLVTRNELSSLEEGTITESSSANKQMWTALWKLEVVPKVRVFWWRVLRCILPDSITLQHRHIKQTSLCGVCKSMNEDLLHALISCTHARKFWVAAKDQFQLHLPRLHPNTWASDILLDQRFTQEERCKIITIMHTIWSSRNRWTHDREAYDPVQAIKWVHETLAILELPSGRRKMTPNQCWRPAEPGWITINTDGAVSVENMKGGAGGVARSHLAFLGAWSKPLHGVSDPFITELLALREAMIFAQLRGFSHVMVQIDCLELVNLWKSRNNSRSIAAPIFEELEEIGATFASFSVTHVSRDANVPAHQCARFACSLEGTESWLDVSPEFLIPCLRADCNQMLVH